MVLSRWMTMLKKDIRILRTRWLISVGIITAIGITVGVASSTGTLKPGVATAFGAFLLIANLLVLPINLFRGLAVEMRTPSLWLQTPQSGWAMLASKLVSSLIGALIFLVVAGLLALWMFQTDLRHIKAMLSAHPIQYVHVSFLLNQLPRVEVYGAVALLCIALYIAMWVGTTYIAVHAVKNSMRKFSKLVGVVVVLLATWGVGAFEHTSIYRWLFGWGKFSALSLFPTQVRSLFAIRDRSPLTITEGHLVFAALLIVLLFYVTGQLIDRHVEG